MRESILIKKIKKGNQEALDTFIEEMYPQVYAFAFRKMQGDDVCKDIAQEVFIRFIRSIPTYREEGKCLHYLYRITSNVCKDQYRRMKIPCDDIDDTSYKLSSDEDVHELILSQLRDEEVLSCVFALSQSQQDIILLKYYHQMTFLEIATIFVIPLSTVKSRHSAALKVLRKYCKEKEAYER